jgi:hypothetical protein
MCGEKLSAQQYQGKPALNLAINHIALGGGRVRTERSSSFYRDVVYHTLFYLSSV